jgi:hypothetical protein
VKRGARGRIGQRKSDLNLGLMEAWLPNRVPMASVSCQARWRISILSPDVILEHTLQLEWK